MTRNAVTPTTCDNFLYVAFMKEAVTSNDNTPGSIVSRTTGEHPAAGSDDALQDLLAGYVSGTLSPAARVLVASYIELNPEISAFVEAMEVACGDSLMAIDPAPLADPSGMLEAILTLPQDEGDAAQLVDVKRTTEGEAKPTGDAILLPEPLREFLGLTEGDVPWKRSLAGFQECRIDGADESSVRLLKLKAGQKMPDHGHHGLELTLVLSGAFSDATGHYGPGAIQIADEHLDHQPVVDAGSECICFTVVEAPLRYRSPLARMVAPLLDR